MNLLCIFNTFTEFKKVDYLLVNINLNLNKKKSLFEYCEGKISIFIFINNSNYHLIKAKKINFIFFKPLLKF